MAIALEGQLGWEEDAPPFAWRYELEITADQWGAVWVQQERLCVRDADGKHELVDTCQGYRRLQNKDGATVVQQVERHRAAIELEIPHWDGSFLRKNIAGWYFYQLSPHAMRNVNPAAAALSLNPQGENLAAWLLYLQTRYSEAFARIEQVCRDALPGFRKLFAWPTPQATVSLGTNEEHLKRPLSLWEMSDGELVFIALLSLIFSPPDLTAALYCVEEPENHLHPRSVEQLIELLRQAQSHLPPQARPQLIATTHSLHVIDCLRLDEVIVFQKAEGATIVSYPSDKAHLRQLVEDRELGLGDLFYSGALLGA